MKFKRILAGLLCAMLTATVAVGCSKPAEEKTDANSSKTSETSKEAPKEPVTLKIWGGVPEEAGPIKCTDDFTAEFKDKGISAEYVRFVNDDTGNLKLETTLLSGEGVDVFISYGLTPLKKRADGGMVLDLTEYIKRDSFDVEKQFGTLPNAFLIDGKTYCIPSKVDLFGMTLNMSMFEKAGIEIPTKWTYSEFKDAAKKLSSGEGDSKIYGTFLNTQQDIAGATMGYFGVQTLGADWMYKEGGKETNFDNPVVKQSIQFCYDLMNVDKTAPTHTDSVTQKLTQEGMFLTGKSAMTVGPWIVRSVKDTDNYPHDFKTAFAPYPTPDGVEPKYSQGGAGDLLSVNAKSKNPDEAWEYVKWYTTKGMLPMTSGGRVPLCNGFDAEEVSKVFIGDKPELLDAKTVKSILINPRENYATQTITTKAPELSQVYKEELEAILNDKKTIDEGIADMKTRGDELLSK